MVNVGKYIIHGSYGYYRTSINIQPFDTQVDQEYPGPADLSDCICNHLFNVMFRQIPASVCTSLLVIPLFFKTPHLPLNSAKNTFDKKSFALKSLDIQLYQLYLIYLLIKVGKCGFPKAHFCAASTLFFASDSVIRSSVGNHRTGRENPRGWDLLLLRFLLRLRVLKQRRVESDRFCKRHLIIETFREIIEIFWGESHSVIQNSKPQENQEDEMSFKFVMFTFLGICFWYFWGYFFP